MTYSEWRNKLQENTKKRLKKGGKPGTLVSCPLCGGSVGYYGPKRTLGCSDGNCEYWQIEEDSTHL